MFSHRVLNKTVKHSHELFDYNLKSAGALGKLFVYEKCYRYQRYRNNKQCYRGLSNKISENIAEFFKKCGNPYKDLRAVYGKIQLKHSFRMQGLRLDEIQHCVLMIYTAKP